MVGMALLKEIEDLLLDKLDRQENCLKFYEQVDDTVRQDMLIKIFDEIDRLEHEIQSMDLLFLSKFEKFKIMNGVDDINDIKNTNNIAEVEGLHDAGKLSLTLIKRAVILIAERERALESAKKETDEIRQKTEIHIKKKSRENKAYSAYKNINK